jgi:large subunit ribosomal protein L32
MAVPKRKTTPSRRNMRRSHDALTPFSAFGTSETGETTRKHHMCLKTGFYRGRKVMEVRADRQARRLAEQNETPE